MPARAFTFLVGLCLATIASLPVAGSEAVGDEPPKVEAYVAPGELGEVAGPDVLITAAENGRELYVFFPDSGEVQRYTEKGRTWGDPIPLRRELLRHDITFVRMDEADGRLVLSGNTGVAVFAADDGELLSQHRIFQPGDSAALPGGDFALSLTNLPHPAREGSFLARGSFGDEVPRLAIYDDDGDVAAKALIESEETTANDAVARSLRVAWGGDRVWAGELGSYQIFSFDRDLDLHDEIRDPELAWVSEAEMVAAASTDDEAESQDAADEESDAELGPEHYDESPGRDLASASAAPPPPTRVSISVEPVLADLDWGSEPGRLYVLLERESFGGNFQMDVLDPLMGEVRRSSVVIPDGADQALKQVTVGYRWVWLRGYVEGAPILRVDREALERGLGMELASSLGGVVEEENVAVTVGEEDSE